MSLRDREIGRRVALHLQQDWEVLDLGSGTGRLSSWLRHHAGIRPTLADVVEFGNRVRGLPYVRVQDPRSTPFEDDSFDAVLLLFVLHHVPRWEDQEALLGEAARVSRHRLILVEDTPMSRADRRLNTAWDWALNLRHGVPKPFSFRTVEGWRQVFGRAGLVERASETYRPLWPTLGTYHHTLFVLDVDRTAESAAAAGC
ncbi:MAG: methyltransferase domain-containing protein [Actinomycetota bacterium]